MDNEWYDGIRWYKRQDGYWYNHTYGLQHVYVWQQTHQATVDAGDVVHHCNENKEDNRPENLKLMTNEDHTRFHAMNRSNETRAKMSKASLGNTKRLGIKHSATTKEKMSMSQRSSGIRSTNSSGYRGVCWNNQRQKWLAQIQIGHDHKYLGLFPTAIEAARAYDTAARKYFGDNCFQNINKDKCEEQHEEIREICHTGLAD